VNDRRQDNVETRANQGVGVALSEAYKIGASTPYDFDSKNLTAYGGLLPIAAKCDEMQTRLGMTFVDYP
jgi:hypothetical protein